MLEISEASSTAEVIMRLELKGDNSRVELDVLILEVGEDTEACLAFVPKST